jgi:hypothetical protein
MTAAELTRRLRAHGFVVAVREVHVWLHAWQLAGIVVAAHGRYTLSERADKVFGQALRDALDIGEAA